ncbi:MAG TPA: patatin-like phospholipase family protein [Thermoanaerobaculia bacterium]|jgi:predicted acylesterase/phospholipase RssA
MREFILHSSGFSSAVMTLDVLRQAKRVAYVFGGGSSRCAFQIGVIERLGALGIHPFLTVGVSAGSWNAAVVAARQEHRIRYYWRSFLRMPDFDLRNLLVDLSPWRYAYLHRRNFARFIGDRLHRPEALPCYISVTRLRDRQNVLLGMHEVEHPIDLLIAANYLPPFYTRTPPIEGVRYGDGGVTDNAPYELAFEQGADAVVLVALKGESEGGIYKSTRDVDHVIPQRYRDRVVVIRPRHRVPVSFTEKRWEKLTELMTLGDLRTREVLLGERHPETEIRAPGESPSARVLRWWKKLTVTAPREPGSDTA